MQVDPPDLGFFATAVRLLRVWREQWRLVLLGLVCALATTGLSLTIPILIRQAIDYSISPIHGHRQRLWPYLAAIELRLHHGVERKVPADFDHVDADHLGLRGLGYGGDEPEHVGIRACPRERHEDALRLHECGSLP